MKKFIFPIFFGLFFLSCNHTNKLSMHDTAFAFSRALLQGNEKVVKQLLLPTDANEKLYKQWKTWYAMRSNNVQRKLGMRSEAKFEIVNTDILRVDSLVIVQVKFDIPNTPNNILKMVYVDNQWLVDWGYSESGNF